MSSSLHAVTYLFPKEQPVLLKEDSVVKAGTKLYLFHGAADDLKTLKVNDVLAVYRVPPPFYRAKTAETGRVRILSFQGDHYVEAVVVDGAIQPGSLAMKGNVACFITSFNRNDR